MLTLNHIRYEINSVPILKDINLHIKRGEIHAILGQNGTGKTTLGSILMGLGGYAPITGKILLNGKDITNLSITERAQRGITLGWQRPVSFEGVTVENYMQLSARKSQIDYKDALEKVGLDPNRYLYRTLDNKLSGGERKRIELAAILAMNPKIAILDEPDSGIDVISLERIANVIRQIHKAGSTVILITHREEIANIASRASSLCAGIILKTGEPGDIISFYRNHCKECDHVNVVRKEELDELR
ncbi:ABC transporter ATP-binding protein [candidate division KSB1 bacterium]|nr:ABC transporter ATP-binding protein [candidate division KSB1 bacterium]